VADNDQLGRRKPGKVTTTQLTGLFLAAALMLSSGCSNEPGGHTHVDRNQDGYCDEDGEPVGSTYRSHSGYGRPLFGWGGGSSGASTSTSKSSGSEGAHISTGSSGGHGGIGSSHGGGGG